MRCVWLAYALIICAVVASIKGEANSHLDSTIRSCSSICNYQLVAKFSPMSGIFKKYIIEYIIVFRPSPYKKFTRAISNEIDSRHRDHM